MNNKMLSVTVAIPAYNEEENIVNLLHSINKQKQTNHRVETVLVYSDGSTDKTVELIRNNSNNVEVLDSKEKLGKNVRVNQMMKDNESDVLIQVDADVTIKNDNTFDNLIAPMTEDSDIGISCAYHLVNKPTTFVGKISHFGFCVWDRARNGLGKHGIRYYCEGGLRAFSKSFTKSFRLPIDKHIGEDSYSFYHAIKYGFKVVFSKDAKIYIDLPESYSDYIMQMKRFLIEPELMSESFGEVLTDEFETMTLAAKLKAFVYELLKSPLLGFCFIALQIVSKVQTKFYKPPKAWLPVARRQLS